jgi:DNA-binding SARP family transcriptional activator/tetratricopeptide (TPR) repeat protein
MEFRLLGPLEFTVDGQPAAIGSDRQRVVLAMLLLEANHVVPLSRLIDAVWDEEPPVTAKSQIQTCVSALRQQLKDMDTDCIIATRPAGYEICISDSALDIFQFRQLSSSGLSAAQANCPEEATGDLRAALAIWRGAAVADVESRIVRAAADRLDEDRLSVLEACIDLELLQGRHHDLVGELSELVRQHPLRERLRGQHMLALYRSGRQAEALEAFGEVRQYLINELGLEPGKELDELHRAILARDQALELRAEGQRELKWADHTTSIVPRQIPAAIADFAGRDEVVTELTAVLSLRATDDGQDRYLPVVVLAGKGGVGKTALAIHVAHAIRRQYPDGHLFVQLREGDGQPIAPSEVLARFLRALDTRPAAIPETQAERIATYRSLLSERRVLVVLDDANSASQVIPLIPGSPECAVIITSRNPLAGLDRARCLEIDDFDEDTSITLISRVIGVERVAPQMSQARALVRLCGCLPLALRIVAAKLAARPHWRIDQMVRRMTDESKRLDELTLPDIVGIRATLSLSYNSLSESTKALFVRLGLIEASDFGRWVCAPLLDMDAEAAGDLLDVLIQAHLVELQINEIAAPRFRMHDLVRIYARERLAAEVPTQERRRVLGRLLGCWLSLAKEAHKRANGGDFAVLHGTAALWPMADDIVDEMLNTPLNWFKVERTALVSAILQAGQSGLDELCWDLAVTSVTLFESENQVEDWRKTHEVALDVARRTGNERGEAAILYSLGNLEITRRLYESSRYLEPALEIFSRLGDVHGRALTLSALASIDRLGGRYELALHRYQDAYGGFTLAGDSVSEIDVLVNMAQIETDRENFAEAEQILRHALQNCRTIAAPRAAAQAEYRLGEFYLRTGDPERAERSFSLVLQVIREHGDLIGEAYALAGLGAARVDQKQYSLATADLAAALDLSRRISDNLIRGRVLLSSAELHLANGEAHRAAAVLDEALLVFGEIGPAVVWRVRFLELRAKVDAEMGRPAAAEAARQEAANLAGSLDPALARSLVAERGMAAGDDGTTSTADRP